MNRLSHLPDLEYYRPNSMKPAERESMLAWHKENFNTPFDLCEKLPEYCMSDCEILANGMLKLRGVFLKISEIECKLNDLQKKKRWANYDDGDDDSDGDGEETEHYDNNSNNDEPVPDSEGMVVIGLDILELCRTIASAAMKIYRYKFMRDRSLAIYPANDYCKTRNKQQSDLALKYMRLLEDIDGEFEGIKFILKIN